MEQLEKMWRNRAEIREMLENLELKVRALEEKRHVTPPVQQVRMVYPVAPPVHHVRVAYQPVVNVPRANVVYTPPPAMWVQSGFDVSKVDPIFREAAKDHALRLRLMDCTDLAMQCALVRHKA
jgi:hypothetical protein